MTEKDYERKANIEKITTNEFDITTDENNFIVIIDNGVELSQIQVCDLLNIFRNENEQLKKENYELHKRLGDFEPFERYMKERTSKTSVNDIIGLVKTDEQTNSVELKKELYK